MLSLIIAWLLIFMTKHKYKPQTQHLRSLQIIAANNILGWINSTTWVGEELYAASSVYQGCSMLFTYRTFSSLRVQSIVFKHLPEFWQGTILLQIISDFPQQFALVLVKQIAFIKNIWHIHGNLQSHFCYGLFLHHQSSYSFVRSETIFFKWHALLPWLPLNNQEL